MGQLAITGGTPVRTAPYPRWPQWDSSEREQLLDALESGKWWATEGSKVPEFEAAWARFVRSRHCVAVTNGTHALEVALLGLGVGEGDEVIVTDYTFFASASAVACVNAVPVLVDVDPNTFCIDPDAVAAAITPRTRAIVAVHLAGHPADLDRLDRDLLPPRSRTDRRLRARARLIVERYSGRRVRCGGHVVVPAIETDDGRGRGRDHDPGSGIRPRRSARIPIVVVVPGEWFYSHFALGGNYRMTEWQGAMLLAQLERFPEQHRARNENALYLNAELSKLPGVFPQARDQRTTAQGYYCYVVRIDEAQFGAGRDAIKKALEAEGIPMTASYPTVHTLDAFEAANGFAPRHRDRSRWPRYPALDLAGGEQYRGDDVVDEASAVDGFARRRKHVWSKRWRRYARTRTNCAADDSGSDPHRGALGLRRARRHRHVTPSA